jgi:hypothetical protein
MQDRRIVTNVVYQFFDDPPVYLATLAGAEKLLAMPHARPGSKCLINLQWFLTARSLIKTRGLAMRLRRHGIEAIVMCNEPAEVLRCKLLGIRHILANQNQFILEDLVPLCPEGAEKRFDAYYAAQARPFKRLHLAADIKTLFVLTYFCPRNASGEQDIRLFEPRLKNAKCNPHWIDDFEQIVRYMHQSHCALALSYKEGAMWAVVEAWMAGLPVVSTPSLGGRSRYFDPLTTCVVRPRPQAIKTAVENFKRLGTKPQDIRSRALSIIEKDREATVELLRTTVLRDCGLSSDAIYARCFKNGPHRKPLVS